MPQPKFQPNKKGLAALGKTVDTALTEAVNAVADKHPRGDNEVIRAALIREMKARGFADFEPDRSLIEIVSNMSR